ncbi:PREDICTED: protein ECERIFERUM 1 isoform X2 [Ipomoea nil]|uniref:protein ECERIFERUM 1 isoform X2 n=1 Tax=Ipomoea nil TaxID=35883 RepID=UPI0009010D39|nr:PREDICTED: protein ECERIFERUM 1 isoform X2 [Ipomoea nil]
MSEDNISSTICKRTVVSTNVVQPGKFCPLTVLDRVMENNFVRIVFYYREFDKDYTKLNESIAETLNAYTIIMGRLLRSPGEQWLIKCNDAGLRVIEAKAKGSVDEWLHNVDRDKELKLVHWEPMMSDPYFWSPFYVQLTEFEEGGLSLGLSCTHLLADPISATMFIKAWADMSFTGKMISPPHFHPLPPRRPCNNNHNPHHNSSGDLMNHYKKPTTDDGDKPPSQTSSDRPKTISLLFTDEMVRACMSMAQTPDAFDALAGLLWTRISKAKNNVGLMDLAVGLDVRKVLGLDKGFYGNCMVYNKVKWSSGSMVLGDDLLSQAANAIRNMRKEMDKEGIMDLIEWLDQNNCCASNVLDGCDSLVCVNLEGVDPYSACFGNNMDPVHVSYYVEPEIGPGNRLLILPSPPGTGALSRTVMVTLPENEAVKLMEDQLIHQLSPCIKMGV